MGINWRALSASDGEIDWRDLPTAKDYYELLEVSRNASLEVIRRAYRVLVEKFHPDKHPPERRPWAEEITKQLNVAHSVLIDPEKRARYDREKGFRR
jgi:molecular chaperone DnaJ